MTNICQLQRGFFTLHTCDRPSFQNCDICSRPVCQFHLSLSSGLQSCIDCAQRKNQQDNSAYDDDTWLYSYRANYYRGGYQPFMYGNRDYQSFDDPYDEGENFDDDPGIGDFSDS